MGIFSRDDQVERSEERKSTFGYVEVRTESGTPLAMATVRDRTRRGALIRADILRSVPRRVQLWFPADQIEVMASARWSGDSEFGVEFDEPIEAWSDNAALKDRVDVVMAHLERAGV